MPTTFFATAGQPLLAGNWVVVHWHLRQNTPLVASFHWKVVLMAYETLALEAQDPDVHLQVQLTPDLARRCRLIQPAAVLRLSDHPVEWRRWRGAGWDVYLTLASNGDLLLFAYKGDCSVSLDLPAGEVALLRHDPRQAKRFLMEALYPQVHPKKAQAFYQTQGHIPAAALVRFVQRYERQEHGQSGR